MPHSRHFISRWLILTGALHFMLRAGGRASLSDFSGWALAGLVATVFAIVLFSDYGGMFRRGEIAGRESAGHELQQYLLEERINILPGKNFGVLAQITPHGCSASKADYAKLKKAAKELNIPGWIHVMQSESDPETWMFSVDIDGARFHSPAYGATPERALRDIVMRKRYCNPVAASYREEAEARHAL